jgi:hypothetical protein
MLLGGSHKRHWVVDGSATSSAAKPAIPSPREPLVEPLARLTTMLTLAILEYAIPDAKKALDKTSLLFQE